MLKKWEPARPASRGQQELADVGALRHARMGSLCMTKRKDLVDDGFNPAGLDQRPHLAQERVADDAFLTG